MDKKLILQALLTKLQEELQRHLAANKRASAGATDSESRAETKWDTCGLEASYLARGHAQQFNKLSDDIQKLQGITLPDYTGKPIGAGALVEVELDGVVKTFLLMPCGGGEILNSGDREVTVVTLNAPLGSSLLGKKQGGSFSFRAGSNGTILSVQ